jgi:hypothetical protein
MEKPDCGQARSVQRRGHGRRRLGGGKFSPLRCRRRGHDQHPTRPRSCSHGYGRKVGGAAGLGKLAAKGAAAADRSGDKRTGAYAFDPVYRRRMSTKHVSTAADLVRFRFSLRIDRGSCGSLRTMNGFDAAIVGGTGSLASLKRRLRCSRCGNCEALLTILSPPLSR